MRCLHAVPQNNDMHELKHHDQGLNIVVDFKSDVKENFCFYL